MSHNFSPDDGFMTPDARRLCGRLRAAGFAVVTTRGDYNGFDLSRHGIHTNVGVVGNSGLSIHAFQSDIRRAGNGRAFLADLAALDLQVQVHGVGLVTQNGKAPEDYQKFWAAMARENRLVLMLDDFERKVTADDIDPPLPVPSGP